MTTPHEEQPATSGPAGGQATPEQAAAGVPGSPSVATAPPRARWRFSRVPARLGRARTSTVVLAVVWLLVALLWLDVRPPSAQIAPTGETGTGTVSTPTTAPARTSSSAPTTAPATAPASTAPATRTTTAPAPETSTASATRTPGTSASSTTGVPARTSPGTQGTPVLPTTGVVPTS